MISISITMQGLDELQRKLRAQQKQIPFATALAVTKTAQQAQQDVTPRCRHCSIVLTRSP